jgi:hypothetical protein
MLKLTKSVNDFNNNLFWTAVQLRIPPLKLMNNKLKFYAVGVLNLDSSNNDEVIDKRLWGLYLKFEDAEEAVLENHYDYFEDGTFNYALIEDHYVIDHSNFNTSLDILNQWWYRAEYCNNNFVVSKIETPKRYKNIFCWWVG